MAFYLLMQRALGNARGESFIETDGEAFMARYDTVRSLPEYDTPNPKKEQPS